MGRRKKGRDISGWLLVDKAAGPTSTAIVNKVRWALDAKKAGHAGTLDPAATGLLAIALGEATKTIPFVTDALKAYAFTIRFGQGTNTDDADGEVIQTSDQRPDADAIRAALPAFTGNIQQIPPAFSAVKIDGERAYAKARAGEEVTLAARSLYVDALTLVDMPDADHATLEMTCGKGGYVRSIARDLAQTLGTCAHVTNLRRLWSGPFDLDNAVTDDVIEALAKNPELDAHILPLTAGLQDLPQVQTTAEGAMRIRNGNPGMVIASNAEYGETCWATYQGEPVAIGTYMAGELHPTRVFVV
ncbi:tRNA pseudouridine(55) synthase TruB [Rhodobacteraceae bacterium]|nr:tRNA pseudouridine(55) synthase TruB [Paracoccaceae bacterium]